MMSIRRSEDRGVARLAWLDSRHSFSFGHYFDPDHMGFRDLRVINDDTVAPGAGFDTHPHRDMEIVTYPLSGGVAHRDTLGNETVVRAGEIQRMSAGTGILHSEFNASQTDPVNFLQIWILPEREGLSPGYEQVAVPDDEKRDSLRLVAARDGRDGALTVHQDVEIYASVLTPGTTLSHRLRDGRHAWLHLARGSATVNGAEIAAGDGVAFSDVDVIEITAGEEAELLLFDLA